MVSLLLVVELHRLIRMVTFVTFRSYDLRSNLDFAIIPRGVEAPAACPWLREGADAL